MKILVLGANGQLGSDIVRLWRGPGVEVVSATRADADVTDLAAVEALVTRANPDVVINTTAFHNLALCEEQPETTFRVNAIGGWDVAHAAAAAGARVVQMSTDYVFDGEKRTPYLENDARRALNVYGAAKIATEDLVRMVQPEALVVRVSGLYGIAGAAGKGGNFVETMLRLAHEGQRISVVANQVTAPTNTADIAEALLPLIEDGVGGVVHMAAGGACSWHEFASAIFEEAGLAPECRAITAEEFGGPVKRPAYSVLGTLNGVSLQWRVAATLAGRVAAVHAGEARDDSRRRLIGSPTGGATLESPHISIHREQ